MNRTGIEINTENGIQRVKFQLILITGDNLGLNEILGFTESFKTDFFCRICKTTVEDTFTLSKEDESKLRTKCNYESDISQVDVKLSGIEEKCLFHKFDNFHVTENITVDVMHDLLEGICQYIMTLIIYTYVIEKKLFSLETLNSRIQNFCYGSIEKSNKPEPITMHRLTQKLSLKMSAAEMLCFVRYLGLMIGDLIPKNDAHWKLCLNLRKIIDIVLSPRITYVDANELKTLIENLNKLYKVLYGPLKPKFHFSIHYPQFY